MSGAKRAIIHVGTHKTGTTSFQRLLAERCESDGNPDAVRPHVGFWIPSHVELAVLTVRDELITSDRMLYPDSALPAVRERLRRHVRETVECDAGTVVFSCEGLSYIRTPEEVRLLVDLMSPRTVEIVCVFRDPASFLASYRETMLRFDGLRNLSLEQGSVGYVESDSWLVDYDEIRHVWRDAEGVAAFTEIDYDATMARDGTVLRALAEAVGLQFDPATAAALSENRRADLPPSRVDLEVTAARLRDELAMQAMALEDQRNRWQMERESRQEAERALRDVLASPSWRLTAPLRRLKRRFT